MKTIYLDEDFMCHLSNDGAMVEIQTDVFDSTVDDAIPYYRFIPQGEEWTDSKGRVLHGIFIQATNSAEIERIIQRAYIADMQNALAILGVVE